MDEQQFLVIKDASDIDLLDEKLYCYENAVFTFTPAIQKRTSYNLLKKVEQFIDSVPAIQKAVDNMQSKNEYIPRLDLISDEIKKFMQEGKVEIIPCKSTSDAYYLQIRSTVKRDKMRLPECQMGEHSILLLNEFRSMDYDKRYILDTSFLEKKEIVKEIIQKDKFLL